MGMTANLHNVTSVKADGVEEINWLKLKDGDGNSVTIFMEPHEAKAMADVWAAAHASESGEVAVSQGETE